MGHKLCIANILQALVRAWINHLITVWGQFQNEAGNYYYNLKISHDQNPPQNNHLPSSSNLHSHISTNFSRFQCPHQKQSNRWSQYESGHHVRTVVSVLWDSVEAGEEGRAERAQTEHGLGQAAGLGLDGAGDVHLERKTEGKKKCRKWDFHVVINLEEGLDGELGVPGQCWCSHSGTGILDQNLPSLAGWHANTMNRRKNINIFLSLWSIVELIWVIFIWNSYMLHP